VTCGYRESSTLDSIVMYMSPAQLVYKHENKVTNKRTLVSTAMHKLTLYLDQQQYSEYIEVLYVDRDLVVLCITSLTARSPKYFRDAIPYSRLNFEQGSIPPK